MTITLTKKESEEYFYNSLCNGLGYFGGYGIRLEYSKKAYEKARQKLLSLAPTETPCFEDVLMQILRQRQPLTFTDVEGDGEMTRIVNLSDIHKKVCKTPVDHLMDMINGNDDAITADVIIQTVLYDEIIFG